MDSESHNDDSVRHIIQSISDEGRRLEQNEPGSREALMESARSLLRVLESPIENIFNFILAEVGRCPPCKPYRTNGRSCSPVASLQVEWRSISNSSIP